MNRWCREPSKSSARTRITLPSPSTCTSLALLAKRATDGVVNERHRTLFSGRIGTGARDENEREESNGRCNENGVRTSPKKDVLDQDCAQFLHDRRAFERFVSRLLRTRMFSLFLSGLERKEMCYSAVTPPKEADRLVIAHKAGPRPSTFTRKDDDHDYSY
jgi:hypothetical protein